MVSNQKNKMFENKKGEKTIAEIASIYEVHRRQGTEMKGGQQ